MLAGDRGTVLAGDRGTVLCDGEVKDSKPSTMSPSQFSHIFPSHH
jgi:hypothetical protein